MMQQIRIAKCRMSMLSMTSKILLLMNQVFMKKKTDCSFCLLSSDILENIPSWLCPFEREMEESTLRKLHSTRKGSFNDYKGVTDQVVINCLYVSVNIDIKHGVFNTDTLEALWRCIQNPVKNLRWILLRK